MKLTRRSFIRLLGVSSLASVLSACGIRNKLTPPMDPTPTPPAPIPPPVAIPGGDAEVWAWQKMVTGTIESPDCGSVSVRVNDQEFSADVQGKTFTAEVALEEGANTVTAACSNGGEPSAPHTYQAVLRNVPESNIQITVEDRGIHLDASSSQPALHKPTQISEVVWIARAGNPTSLTVQSPADHAGKTLDEPLSAPQIELSVPEVDGEYFIQLRVRDETGREDTSTTYFVVENGQPRLDDWSWENTNWIESAVVYGVIPRNFGGKGFASITERLDILQDLGINALWLAPIHPSPGGDYGYAVKDYFEINERYGSKEDFRSMVQEAHRRGIRVLMDLVPNHSSIEHRYFQHALKNGEASHHWKFYDRDDTGAPTHYFNWTNLPNLNYDNPEVEAWMIEASSYWVREFDIDGYRVDVAWGIKERKPDFWPKWRAALKRIKPDVLLLAEASARDPYYFTDGFDAAYDWTAQLGNWAWEQVFENKPHLLTYNLTAALTNANKGFHPDSLIFHFLNNNDTERRFISRYGIDLLRVSTTLLLTLPGLPCLYTGDEVGEEFTPYGDPQPLSFTDKHGLFDFHKQLVHLRREIPALHSRQWALLEAEPHTQVMAYLRLPEAGQIGSPALVVLNFFAEPAQVQIPVPVEQIAFFNQPLVDLLTGEKYDTLPETLDLKAYQTLILTAQE